MEVSFTVPGEVGLPESIDVRTEALSEWNGTCPYLKPFNSSTSVFLIQDYLNMTNRSQDTTVYYDDGADVLVHLEGYDSFAVFSIANQSAMPVSDPAEIDSTVSAYVSMVSPRSTEGNSSALYKALLLSAQLKQKPETQCYELTGMSRYPCVDRKSCMFACFSVPVCAALGENGWSFMDTIMDYNKSVVAADAALDTALSSSKTFSDYPSHGTAQQAFNDLVTLNRAETKVLFHPLLTSYGFCEEPDYALPQQTSARRELLDYLSSTCMDYESGRMESESLKVAPFLAARPAMNKTAILPAANMTADNVSIVPAPVQNQSVESAPIINQTENALPEGMSCCAAGVCSLAGIERIGGVCWEWSAGFALLLALLLTAVFFSRNRIRA